MGGFLGFGKRGAGGGGKEGYGTHVIIHICGAIKHGPGIISPLLRRRNRTILRHLRAVEDPEVLVDKHRVDHPIPSLLRPVRICLIIRVPRQPSGELEEASIRNTVLVFVPLVELENLPSEAPVAVCCVPSSGLLVEDGLC